LGVLWIGLCAAPLLASAQAATARQLRALSLLESGNHDHARGKRGEISRYQIAPKVWAHYTTSRKYTHPGVARTVAERILREREAAFRKAVRRSPTDAELFLLWSCPTRFRAVGYDYHRISAGTRRTAERFAALARRR
jgi:hypothetical protein